MTGVKYDATQQSRDPSVPAYMTMEERYRYRNVSM